MYLMKTCLEQKIPHDRYLPNKSPPISAEDYQRLSNLNELDLTLIFFYK